MEMVEMAFGLISNSIGLCYLITYIKLIYVFLRIGHGRGGSCNM